MNNYSLNSLITLVESIYRAYGFNTDDAKYITDTLIKSDAYGIRTHGINRLMMYHTQILEGLVKLNSKPEIVFESPVSCVIDGHEGMGQLVSRFAMSKTIEKAKRSGICLTTVRNSNHYGFASYYSLEATKQNLIGISMTNSLACVVPTHGVQAMLGTNPIAVSIPTGGVPFNFDVATSTVPLGKIEVAQKEGKQIPDSWGLDENYQATTNPSDILKSIYSGLSGLFPLGGESEETGSHKGYGLSMLVEYLTGIISLGQTSNHIEEHTHSGVSHFFMVIDPKIFGPADLIQTKLNAFLDEIKTSKKSPNHDRIYIHGEKEFEYYERVKMHGLDINDEDMNELKNICAELNIDVKEYIYKEDSDNLFLK